MQSHATSPRRSAALACHAPCPARRRRRCPPPAPHLLLGAQRVHKVLLHRLLVLLRQRVKALLGGWVGGGEERGGGGVQASGRRSRPARPCSNSLLPRMRAHAASHGCTQPLAAPCMRPAGSARTWIASTPLGLSASRMPLHLWRPTHSLVVRGQARRRQRRSGSCFGRRQGLCKACGALGGRCMGPHGHLAHARQHSPDPVPGGATG
jgi:hypothetical protein